MSTVTDKHNLVWSIEVNLTIMSYFVPDHFLEITIWTSGVSEWTCRVLNGTSITSMFIVKSKIRVRGGERSVPCSWGFSALPSPLSKYHPFFTRQWQSQTWSCGSWLYGPLRNQGGQPTCIPHTHESVKPLISMCDLVYCESIKWELKMKPISECLDEKFSSVMGECVI